MDFFDLEWYPMILVGRTGEEEPKEVVDGVSIISKTVDGDSRITKTVDVKSTVIE